MVAISDPTPLNYYDGIKSLAITEMCLVSLVDLSMPCACVNLWVRIRVRWCMCASVCRHYVKCEHVRGRGCACVCR